MQFIYAYSPRLAGYCALPSSFIRSILESCNPWPLDLKSLMGCYSEKSPGLTNTTLGLLLWEYFKGKSGPDLSNSTFLISSSQVREVQLANSLAVGPVLQFASMALVAVSMALHTAWDLTLVTLVTLPISIVVLGYMSRRLRPALRYYIQERGAAAKITNTAISAIEMVKSYNGQDFEVTQYAKGLRRVSKYFTQQSQVAALQIGLIRVSSLAMFVQGFWYGRMLVQKSSKASGDIVTVFWACLIFALALQAILPRLVTLQKGRSAAEGLRKITAEASDKSREECIPTSGTADFRNGNIELTNVSICAYPK